jgi:putative ABC transport system permease protein
VGIYFLQDTDFYKRTQIEMPVLAVPLSNYNALLKLAGNEPVTLPPGSFAIAWNDTALEDEIADFERKHPTIQAGGYTLNKAPNADYQHFIGLGLFTSRKNAVYIIPDEICNTLTLATTYYAANTTEPLTYGFAKDLESDAMDYLVKANGFPENVLYIRLKELQLNEGISNSLMLRLGGTYTALMLIVICFTILSLQQLTEALEHKSRFKIILKLGISERLASKYIRQQISVWFGLPIGLSLIGGAAALFYLAAANYRAYIPYVSVGQLITGIAITYGIILAVLICYFISTYYLFKRMVFR